MARADRVPFLPNRALVLVRAAINGRSEFQMVVDSGAEQTIITPVAAGRLGLDLSSPLRYQRLAGVGLSAPVPVVRLLRVEVGSSGVAGIEASVMDLPSVITADGLLGLNFLRRFRVTFEFDRGVLVLRPRPGLHG